MASWTLLPTKRQSPLSGFRSRENNSRAYWTPLPDYIHGYGTDTHRRPLTSQMKLEQERLCNILDFCYMNSLEDLNGIKPWTTPDESVDLQLRAIFLRLQVLRRMFVRKTHVQNTTTEEVTLLISLMKDLLRSALPLIYKEWEREHHFFFERRKYACRREVVMISNPVARLVKRPSKEILNEYKKASKKADSKRDQRLAAVEAEIEFLDLHRNFLTLATSPLVSYSNSFKLNGIIQGRFAELPVTPANLKKIRHGVYEYTLPWDASRDAEAVVSQIVVRRNAFGRFYHQGRLPWGPFVKPSGRWSSSTSTTVVHQTTINIVVWDEGITEEREELEHLFKQERLSHMTPKARKRANKRDLEAWRKLNAL